MEFSFLGFETQAITINGDQINVSMVPSADALGEGHRWFDLVRNNKLVERVRAHNLDAMDNIQSHHVLRPIPLDQIDRTEGGYPQNPGYTQ